MPPARRRTASGPAAKGAQKTLSFGTKVSKPATAEPYHKDSTTPSTAKAHPLSKSVDGNAQAEPEPTQDEPELDTGHITSEAAVAEQARVELSQAGVKGGESGGESADVVRAERVTDAQIRKYWKEREAERMTRRVHQEELGVEEKILRLFDMSGSFGPAIGIARMKRWMRAQKLGLNPPIEVLAVLLKEEKKGNEKIERAYVDELMSSKVVVGDAA